MDQDFPAAIAAGEVWVAGDPLAAYIVMRITPDALFIENVATARPGLGLRLLRFAEAEARRRRSSAIRLYTNASMTENLALYPRLGYVETERRREAGFDRVYFEKRL